MDYSDYFRFLLALIFVLAMIGILALLARKAGFGYPSNPMRSSGTKRIQVIETAQVDGRRRLVLVKRDHVEHLLILGQNTETIIETGIIPPPPGADGHASMNSVQTNPVEKLAGRE